MKWFIAALISISFLSANAQVNARHGASQEQLESMALHNLIEAQNERANGQTRSAGSALPFAEYQTTKYVVFSDTYAYDQSKQVIYSSTANKIKETVAKNLPNDVTLLVYTDSSDSTYHSQLFNKYAKHIAKERLKILYIPNPKNGYNFWTRDNLPLPVWENSQFALVDPKYYRPFEPDSFFQNLFGVSLKSHNYYHEGGNFIANAQGDCIVVNRVFNAGGGVVSDTAAIPDDIFTSMYGCKKLMRLKHLKGIGHADEVVKFVSDTVVFTDTPQYAQQLKNAGYEVVMLPEPELDYETYINSLQVNDTIFVPTFGEAGDQAALDAYKKLGLNVVPVPTRDLATMGQGGIHCITMNYPPSAMAAMISQMGAQIVR